ncbi:CAP domain-containing protein [Tropicimonas sp. IMCC6043]|uniref:CAP domain-containing protein n=1 Tax=Tropicimonas sp. IMCC6043 TaxID=2510645 RepID=UPI001F5E07A3|nr:CAP domain-containing protein [Tropicimonas sp. IMCC6043]
MVRAVFAVVAAVLLCAGSAVPEITGRMSTKQVTVSAASTDEIAARVNATRRSKGRATLTRSAKLDKAAMGHARDMARRGYFSHKAPDGTMPRARTLRAGYRACLVAENIAYRWRTPEQVVTDWMNSPKHREIMLLREVTEFGVGYASGDFWVLVVARPGC